MIASAVPQPMPQPATIPPPRDEAYEGTLRLHVDVTDVVRGIFRVRQSIPVSRSGGDECILLYPKWLPGFHAPQAPIELFAGFEVRTGDEILTWKRHPVTVNAFAIDVPEGVAALEAEFQFLSPTAPAQGRVVCTPDMLCLSWNTVVLYPAGYFARRIVVEPRLTLPSGWSAACALDRCDTDGDTIVFAPTSLDVLVDSPVLAGRHVRREALDEQVYLTIVADQPHQLAATPGHIDRHRAVVEQADRLFRSRPFDRFEMLLALSDTMTGTGIEHHRSFEAVSVPNYFTDWSSTFVRRDTVPHEYVHSWNGKYRRGSDSWTPSFETPIRNSLMWVYEGQTQYWTNVLAARSGLWTLDQTLGALAQTAARYDVRPGSRWRPTIDTTRDPILAARSPLPWPSWQRSEDYYAEGSLIWLDVDTRLRELSRDTRSLDDFARVFFGGANGDWTTRPYDFDEIVATLVDLTPFDWRRFFKEQLTETHDRAPLSGLERGGYRLVYREEPSEYQRCYESVYGQVDLTHSLGLTTSPNGSITDVLWDGPAFEAGMTIGTTIVGVGSCSFSPDELRRAVGDVAGVVRLTVTKGSRLYRVSIAAGTGLRYPHLERIKDRPARLDDILRPVQA